MSEPAPHGWYCVRCKPRQEGVAAGQLATLEGVELVFPRVRRTKRTDHGNKVVTEPLFPGYLFAAFSPEDLQGPVNHTRGVLHLVRRDGKPVAVEPGVIAELRSLGPDAVLTLEQAALAVGDKVRIVRGVFAGTEGEVVRLHPPAKRIAVLLQLLGAEQSVDIAEDDIEGTTA
jgi:transcriptional antiterminator RfaH